jgi:hypothetical protein
MTTINGMSGIGGTGSINFAGALTPDALMTYCATRLRGLDDQMQTQLAGQQQARDASGALNELTNKLSALGKDDKGDGIHADDPGNKAEVARLFKEAIDKTPPGPARDMLCREHATFTHDLNDNIMSKGDAAQMATRLGTITKELNDSAELDMISLQSLMSQRQTAIQMCTNLVAALGESTKTITQKIGA